MENKKQKLAFITYRKLGDHKVINENGHYKYEDKTGEEIYNTPNHEIHVWQSTDIPNLDGTFSSVAAYDNAKKLTRIRLVNKIFEDMGLKIKDFDHVFLYVGNKEGLDMIDLVDGLPEEKVTYVMCDCKKEHKLQWIKSNGHKNPNIVKCDCEDYRTLDSLLKRYL